MTMGQVKNRFDKETQLKILKGAGFAATGAIACYLLDNINMLTDNKVLTSLVVFLVPALLNAIREWSKGVNKEK